MDNWDRNLTPYFMKSLESACMDFRTECERLAAEEPHHDLREEDEIQAAKSLMQTAVDAVKNNEVKIIDAAKLLAGTARYPHNPITTSPETTDVDAVRAQIELALNF